MRRILGDAKSIFKGRFTTVNEYLLKDDGKEEILTYECVDRGDSVTAIVYNPEKDHYYFVRQFRVGAKKEVLELVAGMFDRNRENPEDAIIREVEEELGYTVRKESIRLLSAFYSSPGGLAEKMFLYYVETGERKHEGGGIDDEAIEIVTLDKEEIATTLFEDAKTIIGALYISTGKL